MDGTLYPALRSLYETAVQAVMVYEFLRCVTTSYKLKLMQLSRRQLDGKNFTVAVTGHRLPDYSL